MDGARFTLKLRTIPKVTARALSDRIVKLLFQDSGIGFSRMSSHFKSRCAVYF